MGILAPPLLTVVIFLWAGSTIQGYLLRPVTDWTRDALVWWMQDIRTELPEGVASQPTVLLDGEPYWRLDNGAFIPLEVFETVRLTQGADPLPQTGLAYYRRYVEVRFLRPWVVIPFFLSVFILLLYLLGKFMAAGIGRVVYNVFERFIFRVPLVRNVYSAVKQVSEFFFSEREVEFKRVVAIEYPRKGIWSVGFVTGEGFLDVHAAAAEPVLSVLVATSPMPMTGFTALIRRSEVVDLDITVDQALEYLISCGVVVPAHQVGRLAKVPGEGRPGAAETAAETASPDGPQPAASPKAAHRESG